MNNNQKFLVALLSYSIRNKPFCDNIDYTINWDEVFIEAKKQNVAQLIYPLITELDTNIQPDSSICEKWRYLTLLVGLIQTTYISNAKSLFQEICDAGIPIIALKGLVLRELYPHPELRSMSDFDILVQKEDIEKAKLLLVSLGYSYKKDYDSKEIHFYHKSNILIELHWRLTVPGYIKNADVFENRVWKNSVEYSIFDFPIRVLSINDQIIHLCLHMVFHLYDSGINLRMLCDLVLFVENNFGKIDWDELIRYAEELSITKFMLSMLVVCNKLLNMKLPDIPIGVEYSEKSINKFIADIFDHVNNEEEKIENKNVNQLLKNFSGEEKYYRNKVKLYLKILFPSYKGLTKNYSYIYKRPYLYPIAWWQHLIKSIFSSSTRSQINQRFKFDKQTYNRYKEKLDMLKGLGIR